MPEYMDLRKKLRNICKMSEQFGTSPTYGEMPRLSLDDKGIGGPTAAHKIEEIHTPLNIAYTTYTTGTTAFQNLVGVTFPEIEARKNASRKFFESVNLLAGDKILVTYPPLINVFPFEILKECGIQCNYLVRSNRDAFLCALIEDNPKAVLGESSFICATLRDAEKLGVANIIQRGLTVIATGTPLDMELFYFSDKYGLIIHDLYGCQEFGWLTIDGKPLRNDLSFVPMSDDPSGNSIFREVVVGGLPTGDNVPISASGHICNKNGEIITYRKQRLQHELKVVLKETTLNSVETVKSVVKTILRIKSKIITISPQIITGMSRTRLDIYSTSELPEQKPLMTLYGPDTTELFDSLVRAQLDYQQKSKADPVWTKHT